VYLGLGGGATFPVSNLSNSFNTGYNILADLGAHFPGSPIGVRLDGMFNQLPAKVASTGNAQIWTANANLVVSLIPGAMFTPYLIAGAGYYNGDYHIFANSSSGTVVSGGNIHANNFGLNGGGGVKLGLGSIALFAEARYHYIFTNPDHFMMIPITAGIRFGG
jgi:opacity protein-like surface antigen